MIIKINDHEPVELRFTFSSFIAYEDKFNEPLNLDGISFKKMISFYYYVVLCSKKGWQTNCWLKEDEFMDWLNDNPTMLYDLGVFVGDNFNMNDILSGKDSKKN